MTNGIDNARCVETSSNVREKWRSMRKRAAEKRANRSCTAGTVPAAIFKASRFAREDFIRGTMPWPTTTAADSSIPFTSFTTADDVSVFAVDTLFLESSVSTERETGERCSPHLVAGRRRRTCGADSSISFASFTTSDDVSALSVDTLFLESSVSTERETGKRCSPLLVAGRRRRTCGADSSISSASCTIADDVSASSVNTSISDIVRDTMP